MFIYIHPWPAWRKQITVPANASVVSVEWNISWFMDIEGKLQSKYNEIFKDLKMILWNNFTSRDGVLFKTLDKNRIFSPST